MCHRHPIAIALLATLALPVVAAAQAGGEAPSAPSAPSAPAAEAEPAAAADAAPSTEAGDDDPAPSTPASAAPDAVEPRVLHRPISTVRAGKRIDIRARVAGDWRLDTLEVAWRPAGTEAYNAAPLERAREGHWIATIPAEAVRAAGLEYHIRSRAADGTARNHFASAEAPHPVQVDGQAQADTAEEQLARYGGARSRIRLDGTFLAHGAYADRDVDTDRFSDRYWTAQGEWTYRTLEVLHDMRFGAGLMRADWATVDDEVVREEPTPGLNYAYAEFNFELHRWFSTGGRILLGATAESFTAGFGVVGRIGDIAGTHLAVRYDLVRDVGTTTDLRFHWTTVPRMPMSLGITFTDWPVGSLDAANLSYTTGFELDDVWTITARVGTANRSQSLDGGWQGGVGLMMDF